ncbi:glycosyltransferase [Terrarubrum flagellatum]|uniref:glycosyltransferase n=1 Tax=Terrirubrum flagellatum TaxID=2895980 RepID=UPI0031454CD4
MIAEPPRRKLLFYTHALEAGGAERVIALLASGFAERGDEVIIAVDHEVDTGAPLSPRVRVVHIGPSHADSIGNLKALLKDEAPDISFSALAASNLKHALAAFAAGRNARAVISYHGYFDAEPQLLSRAGYVLISLLSRIVARTVCVSDGLLAHIRRLGASHRTSLRIFNPVALMAADEADSGAPLADRPPLILAVGRLAPVKDFASLIAAFARIRRGDARLRIVGEGAERPKLEAEIARLGLGGRVELAGHSRDVAQHYRQARCFALTSRTESFGNVVVEALSHGLPVIATDCGGPAEIINGPACGRIAPVGDIDAIASAIDAALDDPGDPDPRRRRARDFSIEKAVDAYSALFEQIVTEAAKR